MTFHRAYMDNPRLVSTRTLRPPIAMGHRSYLALAAGSRRAKTPQAVECEASQSGPNASEGNAHE